MAPLVLSQEIRLAPNIYDRGVMEEVVQDGRLQQVGRHWGIETRLDYVRGWTYDEGRFQLRTKHGPQVMETLRNTTIGLLRYLQLSNISRAVKHLDRHPEKIAP